MGIHFLWFLSAMVVVSKAGFSGSSTYRAAVIEYYPVMQGNEGERVAENVKNYVKFMESAKNKGAQIIVFPEGGLTTRETRSYVPDPADKIVPCDSLDPKLNKVLKDLSCASKNNAIYSVVNLVEKRDCSPDDEHCPPKNYYVFNTNVVFDRKGMVIARYSKYNLFDEAFTDHTQDPEMVFFDTDFGVRFGTFTCFDILFLTPAQRLIQQYHITDFVFPTFWFSELPFLSALQAQRGWAETNNVNLLASGVNNPSSASSGSGIYNGKFGQIVQIMVQNATSKMLVADVPKMQECTCSDPYQTASKVVKRSQPSERETVNSLVTVQNQSAEFLRDQLRSYSSEVITEGKTFEKTLCSQNNFCCDFEVSMDALKPDSKNYVYRAMVFNGVRKFGKTFRGGVQSCGVVLCSGNDIMNCTSQVKDIWGLFKFHTIRIKGNFNLRNAFQMPSTLTVGNELKPLSANQYDFQRTEKDKTAHVSLELVWPVVDLQAFAIWGRDVTRDMEPEVPQSGTSSVMSIPSLILSLVAFFLFTR